MNDEFTGKHLLAGKIRAVSFSLLGFFLIFMTWVGGYSYISLPVAVLIITEIFFNQPYRFILKRVNLNRLQYYEMATDIICITWITYYMGGDEVSFMALAYAAVILWAGSASTPKAVFFASSLSSVLFSLVIAGENLGFLPEVSYYGGVVPLAHIAGIVAGNVSFFFALGYFSAISAGMIRKAEKEKYEEVIRYTHKLKATSYLVGYTTHDAVNHLANISGYAGLLAEEKGLSGEVSGMIRSIGELAAKGTALLARLMRFSRNDETMEKVDVNSALEDAIGLTGPFTRYSKIVFKKELSDGLPSVSAQKIRLQEVFTALILNSYEALKGEGEVLIRTFLSAGRDKICIMFSDNGEGMREEDLARVRTGEIFFKGSGDGKKAALGLVTSREIVRGFSGTIDITSSPGKGVKVEIELPIIQEEKE